MDDDDFWVTVWFWLTFAVAGMILAAALLIGFYAFRERSWSAGLLALLFIAIAVLFLDRAERRKR